MYNKLYKTVRTNSDYNKGRITGMYCVFKSQGKRRKSGCTKPVILQTLNNCQYIKNL